MHVPVPKPAQAAAAAVRLRLRARARTRTPGQAPGRPSRLRTFAIAAAAFVLPMAVALPVFAGGPDGSAPRAAADTVPQIPTGTVTQDSVPLVVGGAAPVTTTFTAKLPASASGPVTALLAFNSDQLPPGGYTSWRVTGELGATCAVDGGAFQPCWWTSGGPDKQYDYYVELPLPTVNAAPTITYQVRVSADLAGAIGNGTLTGWVLLKDSAGDALADGGAQLRFKAATDSPYYRPAMYGVDYSGVMWRYDGTAPGSTAPFLPRAEVGAGWGVYTAVTPLIGTTSAGSGDVVARDSGGVLWYYRASGNPAQPFKPRVKVGGGWNVYTAIAGTGGVVLDELSGRRSGDLVARDSSGVLWYYRATGNPAAPFAPRARVGSGWNAYNSITTCGDTLVARDTSGVLWEYVRNGSDTGSQPFFPRDRVGAGWNIYTAMSCAGAGYGRDLLLARDGAGKLWSYSWIAGPRTYVGGGWNVYRRLF